MSASRVNALFPETFVNINGEICDAQDAKISIFDRGFLYGDSIYEVTYADKRCALFMNEHLDRLENSASLIGLPLTLCRDDLRKEIMKTLKHANLERAYIRFIITRGTGDMNLDPTNCVQNSFIIMIRPLPDNPPEWYSQGIKLCFVSVLRNDKRSVDPNAKSGNYLNNVLAIKEAKSKGFFDALMINSDGHVTEGTTFNIWLVKDNIVKTPALEAGLLKGITRTKLIQIMTQNKLKFEETTLTPSDFHEADEVFITSSTKGLVPVNQVDEKKYNVSDYKTVGELSKLYKDLLNEILNESPARY